MLKAFNDAGYVTASVGKVHLGITPEEAGFQIHIARDGEEALLAVEERKPDLILLDWMLPYVSGIEICRRIRRNPEISPSMQELAIKQMEAEHKAAIDQAKIEIEGAKLEQRAVTDAARLDLQEEIADNRNEVNQDRIEMQRESMMRKGLG